MGKEGLFAILCGLIVIVVQSQKTKSDEMSGSSDNSTDLADNTSQSCGEFKNRTFGYCKASGSCVSRCGNHLPDPIAYMMPACSCDKHCVNYKDCCWDFTTECPNEAMQAQTVKDDSFAATCVEMDFGGSWVISSCAANYTHKAIIDKCKNNTNDIISSIPAYDKDSGRYYKNIYCALCSWVSSMRFWDVYGQCSSELMIDGLNIKNIQSIFDASLSQCVLWRYPSVWDDIFNLRHCVPGAISECEDGCSDHKVKELCDDGFQNIVTTKYLNFKNEFCAYCNPSLFDATQAGLKCGAKHRVLTVDSTKGKYNFDLFMYYKGTAKDEDDCGEDVEFEFLPNAMEMYDMGTMNVKCNIFTYQCKYTTCAAHYKLVGDECRLKDLLLKVFVTFRGDVTDFSSLLAEPLYGPLKREFVKYDQSPRSDTGDQMNITVQIMLPANTSIDEMNNYVANLTAVIEGSTDAGLIQYTLPGNDTVIETPASPCLLDKSNSGINKHSTVGPRNDPITYGKTERNSTENDPFNNHENKDTSSTDKAKQEPSATTEHTPNNKGSYHNGTGNLLLVAFAVAFMEMAHK